MDAACEEKKDESDRCNPSMVDGIGSASAASHYEPSIDIQPAVIADTQTKRQSLFFSQEASSIFDKALEMHAAPTDDPPMWGDNFEDLREVADMLEDIDDFPTGNEVVGQRNCCYPPNFKAASKSESYGCFLDDAVASAHALDAKLNGEDSKSGDNDVTSSTVDSNSAALSDETDMPLQIMNMDKRIFEDNMFIGDIADAQCELISDAFLYNRGIFDNASPNMSKSKPENRELKSPAIDLSLRKEKEAGHALPASKPKKCIFNPDSDLFNCKVGPPGTAANAYNLLELKAPAKNFQLRKEVHFDLPASSQKRGVFDNAGPNLLNAKVRSPDYAAHAESPGDSKTPPRELPLRKEADHDLAAPKHDPHQTSLEIVTPETLNKARTIGFKRGTPMLPVITPLPQVKPSSEDPTDSMQGVRDCINGKEPTVANDQRQNHKEDNHPRGTSKSDAAWKRRFLELEDFKRQHGHCNVHQKYENNPSLGAWVARQRLMMRHWDSQPQEKRSVYNSDGKSLPTTERIKRLKNIGLEPSIGKGAFGKLCTRNTNEWEKQFSDIIKYRDTHGNCNVPTKTTSLGRWVASQRKKHRQFLADEGRDQDHVFGWSKELRNRFQRLEDIGFNFYVGKGKAQQKKLS